MPEPNRTITEIEVLRDVLGGTDCYNASREALPFQPRNVRGPAEIWLNSKGAYNLKGRVPVCQCPLPGSS